MCVLHKFCIACFCACVMTHAGKSNEGELESKTQSLTGDKINSSEPRDQNVKDVNHIHKHFDKLTANGKQFNDSLVEGLYYVSMIFQRFGDDSHISVENFEKLFKELEYLKTSINVHKHDHAESKIAMDTHNESEETVHDHEHTEHEHEHTDHEHDYDHATSLNEHHSSNHSEHVHNEMKTLNKTDSENDIHDEDKLERNRHRRYTGNHNHQIDHSDCLTAKSILNIYKFESRNIDNEQFLHMCPAILYQQINPSCKESETVGLASDTKVFGGISAEVWGYSTLAVIIISLVGLLGVAIIPIMQKVFYNHLLQFLVALAVGALTGDALLHLLPHAIAGENHHGHQAHGSHGNHKSHQSAVLKGLCGLSGLFFFFLMERVLTIFTKIKRKRKQSKRQTLSPKDKTTCRDDGNHIAKKLSAYDESDYQSCEEMVMVVHPNKSLKGYADETHDKIFHTSHDSCRPKETKHSHSNPQTSEEEGMLTLPHSHSGHSHHAHCEMLTNSVASVAWMVILGDGIHNFSDGLAIGAAFSNSITGGISTAIAVFCHELPHEIGDFAVLLRAGMSIKQAIVYNILSSIMCFVGMLIGVVIGNIDEASQWIFAVVAGMFIYIATVDMLPEMTSVETKQGEHPFCHLFLQCIGMIVGAGIMLLIAFFEEDLLTALDH